MGVFLYIIQPCSTIRRKNKSSSCVMRKRSNSMTSMVWTSIDHFLSTVNSLSRSSRSTSASSESSQIRSSRVLQNAPNKPQNDFTLNIQNSRSNISINSTMDDQSERGIQMRSIWISSPGQKKMLLSSWSSDTMTISRTSLGISQQMVFHRWKNDPSLSWVCPIVSTGRI